jgi:hypothetical protein
MVFIAIVGLLSRSRHHATPNTKAAKDAGHRSFDSVMSTTVEPLTKIYRGLLLRIKYFVDPQAAKRLLQLVEVTRASAREGAAETRINLERRTTWQQRMLLYCRQFDRASVGDPKALQSILERAYGQRGRLRQIYLSALTESCHPSNLPELIPGVPRTRPPQSTEQLQALFALQFPKSLDVRLPSPAGASAKLQKRLSAQVARQQLKVQKAQGDASKQELRRLEDEVARFASRKAQPSITHAAAAARLKALVPPLNPRREANVRWRHWTRLLSRTAVPIPEEDRKWLQNVASRQERLLSGQSVQFGLRIPSWRTHLRARTRERQAALSCSESDSILPGVRPKSGARKSRAVEGHILTDRFFSRLYGRILVKIPILANQDTPDGKKWQAAFAGLQPVHTRKQGILPDESFDEVY